MATADSITDSREQDIEQQLDDLLSQLATVDPQSMVGAETDDSTAAPVTASAVTANPEDKLASQIQEMLDDARVAESPISATADPLLDEPAVPAASAPQVADATNDDAIVPIQAIDEMLAEAADDAVTGEFETLDQVLAMQDAPQETPPPSPIAAKATAAETPAATQTPPPAGDHRDDADDAIAGDFETPEQLLAASTNVAATVTSADTAQVTAVLGGSAAAVAAELNADSPAKSTKTASVPKIASPQTGTMVILCERGLRRILGTINRPLDAVSPATRSVIGWLGVITLFNGGAMLVYSVLHAM